MKKFILAAVVVLGSIGYVFVLRNDNGNSSALTAPAIDTSVTATQTSSQATLQTVPTTDTSVPAPTAPTKITTPTATPKPTPTPVPTPTPKPVVTGAFKDGTYNGSVVDAYYGNIQVAAVINGGRLATVKILQYPSDRRTSIEINQQALPMLVTEAVSAQSANIDAISGASETSPAFIESLRSALAKAKA